MATTDFCDGDYLGAYRRFLEHFVANVCSHEDQLPVKMGRRDVRDCELVGEIADITLQHLNQRICPPSLQAYLVKLVTDEFKILFQKHPEECGYRLHDKAFSPLKLMTTVTNKVNEICQRYLDNSRLALLPPPPSTPLPLVSSYAIKNKRRKMEDRSVVLHDLHTMFSIKNDAVVNYYAVFDGHGGQETATYCAAHLHQYLVESPHYPADPELALRDAFHITDYRFIENSDTKNSGATAVCALLYDKTLYIAWAGDSEAAIIKNGKGINLTNPHKPDRPDERKRIKSLGGEVIYYHGTWRVNGGINVSRAIGDAKYKPFLTEEPDITRVDLDGTEDFLIIACDGFWDRATENVVAELLYEYISSSHCDYNSASEALVSWAKQNFSDDNISVIVVYLTPPAEIAAKTLFDPRPVYSAMEPGYMEQQEQQPLYDLDYGYAGKTQQPPLLQQTNGSAAEENNGFAAACAPNSLLEPINGRHRPKPPRYNDDDDDHDDEEEEDDEEDVDLGPETNVDAVDEAPGEYGKLDEAMGQNYPDEFLIKMPAKREDDEFPMETKKRHQNELIPEADNVADSEDSEDEWNYYRPDDSNKTAEEASENVVISSSSSTGGKDPALVEKPDQCEEKEPCSPKPYEDDNSPTAIDERASAPPAPEEPEVDANDVTAEYDELHETEPTKEHREPQLELNETDAEAETATAPEEELPFDKVERSEQQLEERFNEDHQKEDELEEDMESHLNPEAAEFVPTSNSPTSLLTQRVLGNDLVAGSPLKQSQRALKNRTIPTEEEFQNEISHRPADIEDNISEFSNGEASPQKDLLGGFDYSDQKTVLNSANFEDSEISSTKAEFGDESAANYSVASEFYRTGASTIDCSYTGSERGDFDMMATSMTPGDFKNAFEQEVDLNKVHELHDEDLMDIPQNGTYQNEEEKMVVEDEDDDIPKNKFELDMDNLVPQQQQSAEVFSAVVEERVSINNDIFMNMRNTEHRIGLDQQEEKQPLEQQNLIDTATMNQEVAITAEHEKIGGFSSADVPTYASNNPFAADYVPATAEPENDMQNLANEMKNINLEQEPKEELLFCNLNSVVTPEKEPEALRDEVMQNPLDLNFGATSAEQKNDELVLVSPVQDPEVMTSKFKEENLMCQKADSLQLNQNQELVQKPFEGSNHLEDFGTEQKLPVDKEEPAFDQIEDTSSELAAEFVDKKESLLAEEVITTPSPVEEVTAPVTSVEENLERKSINLSESLQEFTGLEEQLSPKHAEVKDNDASVELPQILKENLVEEPKDIEEVASSLVVETNPEEVPVVTNEPPKDVASPEPVVEAAAVAVTAAAAAATAVIAAATAAKPAAKSVTASKTSSKPAALKTTTKSTTPASPTKTGIASKTSTATKKPTTAVSAAARPKPATGTATKTAAMSTLNKTTATTKTTVPPKTITAPKPTPRTNTAASKTKPLSSVTSKIGSISTADKKPTANGTSKPTPKLPASNTTTKTGLVKTSTTARTNTTAAPKPRPTSTTAAKTTSSRLSTSNVTSSTNSTSTASTRPKTAPSCMLGATAKPKVGAAAAKSPMMDKQIKETANKQISSARNVASTPKSRLSTTAPASSTTTGSKRMSLVQKQSVNPATSSPTKKPAPITKPGSKTTSISKVNSKVSSTTKNSITATATATAKVVQNGVCESEEMKITTTTTTTTNIEEDLPKKDVSPIEPVTDNQLITAE